MKLSTSDAERLHYSPWTFATLPHLSCDTRRARLETSQQAAME